MTQQRCPPGFESGKRSFLGIVELTCDFESMTQQRCPTGDFCWENIAPDQHTDIINDHYQCKTRIRRILDKSQCGTISAETTETV